MPETIAITANGKTFHPDKGTLLPDFLADLGFAPNRVVVERNNTALTPGEARITRLEEGDRLEVVRIVAGG